MGDILSHVDQTTASAKVLLQKLQNIQVCLHCLSFPSYFATNVATNINAVNCCHHFFVRNKKWYKTPQTSSNHSELKNAMRFQSVANVPFYSHFFLRLSYFDPGFLYLQFYFFSTFSHSGARQSVSYYEQASGFCSVCIVGAG